MPCCGGGIMLSSVLSKSQCAACKFCCSFRISKCFKNISRFFSYKFSMSKAVLCQTERSEKFIRFFNICSYFRIFLNFFISHCLFLYGLWAEVQAGRKVNKQNSAVYEKLRSFLYFGKHTVIVVPMFSLLSSVICAL